MDERVAKAIGDLELVLRSWNRLPEAKRESAMFAMDYRVSQLESYGEDAIARQYRSRMIALDYNPKRGGS
jgi:hypothetical protein